MNKMTSAATPEINSKNNTTYGKVDITDVFDTTQHYLCDCIVGYKNHLKQHPNMSEMIGRYRQQVKGVFDLDAYRQFDINEFIAICQKVFPNKKITYANREPREYGKKGIKYSYRVYVHIRITTKNLKVLIEANPLFDPYRDMLDMQIYNPNRVLFLPLTTKKTNNDKHPALLPVDCEIFDCCASYILEEYEDWDLKIEAKQDILESKQDKTLSYKEVTKDDDDCDDGDNNTSFEKKLEEHINALSESRADDRSEWLNMMFCIINIYKKKNLSRRKCENMLHLFSKKCEDKYNEDDVDKWIEMNYDKTRNEGYGWTYLKNCLKQDNPDYYKKKVGETYYAVKKDFEKVIHKCMNPVGFLRVLRNELALTDSKEPIQFMSRQKLIDAYEELKYWQYDEKNKEWVKKPFVLTWLKDENKNIYEEVVFKPYHLDEQLSKKYYNLYEGTRAELLPVCKNYEAIQPVLDHIKNVMVNGNEAHYDWLLQYFAQMIQNPTKKTQVCIVFHGKQGCGKNIIIDAFANGVLGRKLALSTANPQETLFGRFNACCLNKILVVCNEIGSDLYDCMDRLKDLVTAPDSTSEKKYQDPVTVDNYKNVICTTNNKNPLNISTDDRRLVWFDCNNEFIGNEEYFDNLLSILQNDENISSLYHYFKEEVKITITNFQKKRPITKGYKRIQVLNLPSHVRWCKDYCFAKDSTMVFKTYKGVETAVKKQKVIYDDYKAWCERCKYTALKRDTFFHNLEDEETGITCCKFQGYDCYRFNKDKVTAWLDKQGVNKEDVEVMPDDWTDFIEEE